MKLERFRARSIAEALQEVRRVLGEDALVLDTRGRGGEFEVVATTAIELFRAGAAMRPVAVAKPSGRRFRVIGLVGPTGGGKTTTAVKLALGDPGFSGARVGLVSFDTYKVGAYEQIQTYADLADLPLEFVSDVGDATAALSTLADCDIVLVDTPGRSPRAEPEDRAWWRAFRQLQPDEVHFVIPASVRPGVARALLRFHAPLGPTHSLLTKVDEVPGESGVAELAYALGLPTKWICDGQDVPADLHPAQERLVSALLGRASEAVVWNMETVA